jgi:hypothetical protein
MATSLEPTMASFSKCCKSQGKVSDCGCPKGCADEEEEDKEDKDKDEYVEVE